MLPSFLLSAYTLDLSGVPTYTLTLYNELVRRRYPVEVVSPVGGGLAPRMGGSNPFPGAGRP